MWSKSRYLPRHPELLVRLKNWEFVDCASPYLGMMYTTHMVCMIADRSAWRRPERAAEQHEKNKTFNAVEVRCVFLPLLLLEKFWRSRVPRDLFSSTKIGKDLAGISRKSKTKFNTATTTAVTGRAERHLPPRKHCAQSCRLHCPAIRDLLRWKYCSYLFRVRSTSCFSQMPGLSLEQDQSGHIAGDEVSQLSSQAQASLLWKRHARLPCCKTIQSLSCGRQFSCGMECIGSLQFSLADCDIAARSILGKCKWTNGTCYAVCMEAFRIKLPAISLVGLLHFQFQLRIVIDRDIVLWLDFFIFCAASAQGSGLRHNLGDFCRTLLAASLSRSFQLDRHPFPKHYEYRRGFTWTLRILGIVIYLLLLWSIDLLLFGRVENLRQSGRFFLVLRRQKRSCHEIYSVLKTCLGVAGCYRLRRWRLSKSTVFHPYEACKTVLYSITLLFGRYRSVSRLGKTCFSVRDYGVKLDRGRHMHLHWFLQAEGIHNASPWCLGPRLGWICNTYLLRHRSIAIRSFGKGPTVLWG